MSQRTRRSEHPELVFRSKLEAQWSHVFDTIELPWEFEPQLFDLPSGKYLPDFRMCGATPAEFWVEIKGPWPNAREFMVGSEINLYVAPLLILSGDVPRRRDGGTAWWFNPGTRQWSMLPCEEALIRLVCRNQDDRPEHMGPQWDEALTAARSGQFERMS